MPLYLLAKTEARIKTDAFPLLLLPMTPFPGYELALYSQCNELKILLEEGSHCCCIVARPLLQSVNCKHLFRIVDHAQLRAKTTGTQTYYTHELLEL